MHTRARAKGHAKRYLKRNGKVQLLTGDRLQIGYITVTSLCVV